MRRTLAVVLVGLGLGCTPEVDPPWLIERPTELGLSSVVEEQGLFGDPLPDDAPRPYHEALPLDRIRLTPFVADRGGPVPLDELSVLWVLCPAIECVDALSQADLLPTCGEEAEYDLGESCRIGSDASLSFVVGDFPMGITEASVFTLASAPNIAYIGSRVGDPGADVCAQRLRAREALGPCVMMLRDIALGSLRELVEAAALAGINVEVSEGSDELLQVPRNHAPLVQTFAVRGSSRMSEDSNVASGTSVPVAVGDEIEIEYLPTEHDVDAFTIELDDQDVEFEETLTGTWWLDRDAEAFTPANLRAHWTVSGGPGSAYVHLVVADGRGSEAWGWLAFDVAAP